MDHALRSRRSRGDSDVTATSASSVTSYGSSVAQSDRCLLFGEIPQSPSGQSHFSKISTCNLVLSNSTIFLRFWLSENCRSTFLQHVDRDDLPALRLVCNNFAAAAAPFCFKEIDMTFRSNIFKSSRVLSLNRIGRHVKKLRFNVPHSSESFLPPLIDQTTGTHVSFDYNPQVEPTRSREPKYGSWEMTDLLIQQYPPLFHAATDIPSFVRAFSALPNVEHITIFSPDQNMSQRYRTSIADYVLMSLRIAIERAPLAVLDSLTLKAIHAAALQHLQPVLSSGSTPSTARRWTQISHLAIEMDSTPFSNSKPDENLCTLQAYLRAFCTSLTHLSFEWTGMFKGPSPVTVQTETVRCYTQSCTAPACRQREQSAKTGKSKSVRFFDLQYLNLQSASMHSDQVAAFITAHHKTLKEFVFENVTLSRGTWSSALNCLRDHKRTEQSTARMQKIAAGRSVTGVQPISVLGENEMYVPCKLSPIDLPASQLEPEPVIEGTLEPQEPPSQSGSSWLSRLFVKGRKPKGRPSRHVSEHMKRVVHEHILPWR